VQAGTRPTADQLAALAEGDPVTVESGAEFSRTRHTTGTVVRVGDSQILVKLPGPRGVTYVERYGRRDGWRIGRGNRAALVSLEAADPATDERRRQQERIDVLWRAWSRNRGDVVALRELHTALGKRLAGSRPTA
jgi:hypothetical protein